MTASVEMVMVGWTLREQKKKKRRRKVVIEKCKTRTKLMRAKWNTNGKSHNNNNNKKTKKKKLQSVDKRVYKHFERNGTRIY